MKQSKRRIALISSHRKRKDLRGRVPYTEFTPVIRERFKRVFDTEIRRAKAEVNQKIVPNLDLLVQRENALSATGIFDRFKKYFREINISFFGGLVTGGEPNTALYGKRVKRKLRPIVGSANRQHKDQFKTIFNSLAGVNPIEDEPGLKDELELMVVENVGRITTLSEDYFNRIEGIILDAIRSGTANKSVIKDTQKVIDDAGATMVSRANLIANDQLQKLNGNLDKIRQKANGGTRYIWRTRGNARVRDDHRVLNGAIFEWGNPPITVTTGKRAGERNEPGQDIRCKCQAQMVIEDILGQRTKKIIEAEKKTEKLRQMGRL